MCMSLALSIRLNSFKRTPCFHFHFWFFEKNLILSLNVRAFDRLGKFVYFIFFSHSFYLNYHYKACRITHSEYMKSNSVQ